jgi:hypothetical protein
MYGKATGERVMTTAIHQRFENPDDFLAAIRSAQRKRAAAIGAASLGAVLAAGVALSVMLYRTKLVFEQLRTANHELDSRRSEIAKTKDEEGRIRDELAALKFTRDSLVARLDDTQKLLEDKQRQVMSVESILAKSPPSALAKRLEQAVTQPPPAAALASKSEMVKTEKQVPLDQVAQIRLALSPTDKTFQNRKMYSVHIWTDLPKSSVPSVVKVEYYFDHSSFVPKLMPSFDSNNGFSLWYQGYGCVPATATLVARDNTRHAVPFDMCALWSAAKAHL